VLVAGGDSGRQSTSVEIYDPASDAWTLAAPLHAPRVGHTAARLADGRVLVFGGHDTYVPPPPWKPGTIPTSSSGTWVVDDTAEIYDPVADTWTVVRGPLTPRDRASATLLADGRVLVVGGVDANDGALGTCELYDPSTGEWSATGSLSDLGVDLRRTLPFWMRWGHTATLLADGRVLIAGGFADDWTMATQARAEIYDPATGLWSDAGTMSESKGRGWHTATLLPDGRVLVVGGDWRECQEGCGEFTLGTTDIYDPVTNSWSVGPQLHTRRYSHTATLLRDGSLLVVGGAGATSGAPYYSAVDLADVESSAASAAPFTPGAPLPAPREGHTATLLDDGSVLVVGGADSQGLFQNPGIYRPPRRPAP
jgi:hypothetical protein